MTNYQNDEGSILRLCALLDILYESNKERTRLSYKEFYNEKVNTDEYYRKVNYFIYYRLKSKNGS